MDLTLQKKLARNVLKAGKARIWFDPERIEEIKEALTRQDIKTLVSRGAIKVMPKRGVSRARANLIQRKKKQGRKKGPGSKKGRKTARTPKKEAWMAKIRVLRKLLKQLKEKKIVDNKTYRELYQKAGGGFFRNASHLKLYVTKLKQNKGE